MTWKDEHGVVHVVQEEDTGYTDPVYDWVPLCYTWPGGRPFISELSADYADGVPTCLACLNCINRGM